MAYADIPGCRTSPGAPVSFPWRHPGGQRSVEQWEVLRIQSIFAAHIIDVSRASAADGDARRRHTHPKVWGQGIKDDPSTTSPDKSAVITGQPRHRGRIRRPGTEKDKLAVPGGTASLSNNSNWRRRRDSNPRNHRWLAGFQNQCYRPLCHASVTKTPGCYMPSPARKRDNSCALHRLVILPTPNRGERWQSGRMRRFRKPLVSKGTRGFESPPFRQMDVRMWTPGAGQGSFFVNLRIFFVISQAVDLAPISSTGSYQLDPEVPWNSPDTLPWNLWSNPRSGIRPSASKPGISCPGIFQNRDPWPTARQDGSGPFRG